jgi:N-acetylglucosaminyl-diphospho-decaprenol L-rhamnosyltransferase
VAGDQGAGLQQPPLDPPPAPTQRRTRVDVVVVSYESAASLPACLTALPASAGAVVIDNASRDAGADVAESLGATVVRNESNRGFAAAANQGARCGDAEYVLFLNPDAVLGERDLELLLDALERDPGAAAAGPRLLDARGHEQRSWWPFPSPGATWAEAFGLQRLRQADPAVGFAVGACLLVRRDAFEELGGFDERFWLYGEEADLCRRAWDAGQRVLRVPAATARHIGGASGASASALVFEHFNRGTEHFIAKHHGSNGLLVHRVGLLLGSIVRLVLLAPLRDAADRARRARRRAIALRVLRLLATQPTRVPR